MGMWVVLYGGEERGSGEERIRRDDALRGEGLQNVPTGQLPLSDLVNRGKAGQPVDDPKVPGVLVGNSMGMGVDFDGEFWVQNCRDGYYTKGYIGQRNFNF